MIARDFIYVRPDTKEEATEAFQGLTREGVPTNFYGGGSEIITMCRAGSLKTGAVVDLKGIPECRAFEMNGDALVIGGCVTLREITDSNLFPLLGSICGRIADHTNQCRITLGGNLCATTIYRETAQALLIADAETLFYGAEGLRILPMAEAFDKRALLKPGEFFMQTRIPKRFLGKQYFHEKKTVREKIDYPLVSVSAMHVGEDFRLAISGYYSYPFRDAALEKAFNEKTEPRLLPDVLPGPPLDDALGSADYRKFALTQTLGKIMEVGN